MEVETEYLERFPKLKDAAHALEDELRQFLDGTPRIDGITARAKNPDRFLTKAAKKVDNNRLKYEYPLEEIQDQIGARVIVFYKSDVEEVAKRILKTYRVVEDQRREDPDPGRFGYEAQHFVCALPLEIRSATNCPVEFFELQISTLFQHAWSEANHDLGYKANVPIDYETQRKIALAAAQAWGADMLFDEMFRENVFQPPSSN